MKRVVAYLRVSTDKQETENQKYGVDNFCEKEGMVITEYVMDVITGTSEVNTRRFWEVFSSLKKGDVIVVSELSRLSRNSFGVIEMVEMCIRRGINLYAVKENYAITNSTGEDYTSNRMMGAMYGFASQIERDHIAKRVKETYSRKKRDAMDKNVPLNWGRKQGRKTDMGKRKLDQYRDMIFNMMRENFPKTKIASHIGVSRVTLNKFLNDLGVRA
jgi:DNA invertase Pin-like site-specific DNA recombinase